MRTRSIVTALSVALLIMGGCGKKKSEGSDEKKAGQSAAAKAAQSEAEDGLERLYKSAANYYAAPRVAASTGVKLPCQFPESNEWTPAGKACDGKDGKHEVETSQWATATWSSLNFQVNDNHYAAYRVVSSGTLNGATAVLEARVDPDCTGEYTVYRAEIAGDANATLAECAGPSDFKMGTAGGSDSPKSEAKAPAAEKAPGKATCENAVDHFKTLATADPNFPKDLAAKMFSDAERTKMIEKCKTESKPAELECMMAAKTLNDITKCEGKK